MTGPTLPEAAEQGALRARLGIVDPTVFVWPRHVPYFHCGYYRWMQHSAYLRQLEEVVERYLAYIDFPIGAMLRERRWVPIVQEHSLDILQQAEMEEVLYTTFRVTEIFASRLFRASAGFHVVRDARPLQVARGRITHGYAEVRVPDWESRLVRFDDHLTALLERWIAPTAGEGEATTSESWA